jgi:hypothetical protein
MTKTFGALPAIVAASLSVPTTSQAHPAWLAPVLVGASVGGLTLSFRQANRHAKHKVSANERHLNSGRSRSGQLSAVDRKRP